MAFDNTAQRGRDIIIAKGSGSPLTALEGVRSKTFTFNSETVDVTTADDTHRWRMLLAATGIKNLAVSASGVIKDSAGQQTLHTDANNQTVDTYTLTVDGIGTFVGPFTVTQIQDGGDYNGEATFEISLESGGEIIFTAEG